ncbi:MAG: sigma-70 family RNA polymerase sigma factor [Isosphaeraceae bacterium]|nr:sigma-70 family RNA polymerase sigma factor [Isosphaeraceae bacterium]
MTEANDHARFGPCAPISSQPSALAESRILALYDLHGPELYHFLLGVTRDAEAARDVLQATFLKVVEQGHLARPETFKGWLFRVAYREALAARRRSAAAQKATQRLASLWSGSSRGPEEDLMRSEAAERVRQALGELPIEQRQVVWARIYEDKTFAEIAGEFGLPLGTVLTRMRLALERLRRSLRREAE